jgi:D-alanine-D-alanine ligase-like ATP-grasp enzyme
LLLNRLGYEVKEQTCGPTLYERVRKDHPGVVFNLSSIYGWDKSNLVPAVLEIAGVRYTGSGMLGLSLARNYTRLFPLLQNSGVRVPPFQLVGSRDLAGIHGMQFPLQVYQDGKKNPIFIKNSIELEKILRKLALHEKVLLMEPVAGKKQSLFILDGMPFLTSPGEAYIELAQKAFQLMEAKGLARFDFLEGSQPTLINIEISPDPLGKDLLQEAELAGWDAAHILQLLVEHAGNDNSDVLQSPIFEHKNNFSMPVV